MIQLGDVEYKDGDGGTSSFKKIYFADENFDVRKIILNTTKIAIF